MSQMSLRATFVEADSLDTIAVSTPPPQRLRPRDQNAADAFMTPPPQPLLPQTKGTTSSAAFPTENRAGSRARSDGGSLGVGETAANDLTELYDNDNMGGDEGADDDYSFSGFGLLGLGSPSTSFTTERTKEVYGSRDPFDKILVSWEIVSDPRVAARWRLNFRPPEKDLIEKIVEGQREREEKDDAEKDEGGLVTSSLADGNGKTGNVGGASDLPLVELCVARLGPQKRPPSHVLEVGNVRGSPDGIRHGTTGGEAQSTSGCFVELAGQVLPIGVRSANGHGASGLPPLCISPIVLAPEEHNGTVMRLKDVLEDPSITLAKENKKRADAQLQQQALQQQQTTTGGNGSAVALSRGATGTSKSLSTFNNSGIASAESVSSSSYFIRSSSTGNRSALVSSNLVSSTAGQHITTVVGPFSTVSCKVGPDGSAMVAITLKEAEAKEEEEEEEGKKAKRKGGSDVPSLSEVRPLLTESSEYTQQQTVVHTKVAPSRGSSSPLRSTSITLLPPPLTPEALVDQKHPQPTESQLRAEGLVRSPERSPSSTKTAPFSSSSIAAGSSVPRPASPAARRTAQNTSLPQQENLPSANSKAGVGTKNLQPKSILPSSRKVVGRQSGGAGGAFGPDGSPTGYDEDGNHVYVPDTRTAYLTETTLEPQAQSMPNPQIASLTSAAASAALTAIYARIPPSAPLRSVSLLAARVAVAHALEELRSPTSPNTCGGKGVSPESARINQERADTDSGPLNADPSLSSPSHKRQVTLPPLAAAAIGAVLPRGGTHLGRCANATMEVPAAVGLCGDEGPLDASSAQRASRYTEACYWGMGKAGGRWAILNPSKVQLHVSQKNNKGRGRAVVGSGGMGGLIRCSAVDPRVLLSPDEFYNNEEANLGAAANASREGSVAMLASTLPRPSAASNGVQRSPSRPTSIVGDRDKVNLQADGRPTVGNSVSSLVHNQNKMSPAAHTDPVDTVADASYYLRPGRSYGGLGGRGRSGAERDSEQGFGCGGFGGLMAEVEALLANGVLGSEGLHNFGANPEESQGERGPAASNSHATPFLSLNNEPISSYSYSGGIGGAQVNSMSNHTNLFLLGGTSQGGMGVSQIPAIGVEHDYSERDGVGIEAYGNLRSRPPLIENTLVPLSCAIDKDGASQPHPTSSSALGRPASPSRLGVGRGPATRPSSTNPATPAGAAASAARRRRGNSPTSHTNVKDSHDDCGPLSVSVPIVPTAVNTKTTRMPLAAGKALRQPIVTRVAHAQAEVGRSTAAGAPHQQQNSSALRRGVSTVAQAAGNSQGGGGANLRPSSAKEGRASTARPSSAATSHETQSAKEGKEKDKKNAGQGVANLVSSGVPLPTPPLFTTPPKAPQVIRGEFPTDPRHAVAHFLAQPPEVTAACYASAAAEHYAYLLEKALLTGVPATVTSSSNLNMYANFPRLCESAWDALLGIGCSQPEANLSRPLPTVLRNYGFAPSWPLPLNPSLTSALSADATVANLMARPTTYTLSDLLGPSILPETGATQDLGDQHNFAARSAAAGSASISVQYLHLNKMEREREKERVAKELQIVAARTQFEQQYALLSNVAQYLFTFVVGDDHGVYVVVPGRECVSATVPPKRKETARRSCVWSSEQEHSAIHAYMNSENELGLSDIVPLDATQTPEAAAARNAKSRPSSALGNRARSNSKNGGPTSSVTKGKGAGSVPQQAQSNLASTGRRGGASPDDLHTSSLSGQGGSNVNPSSSPEDPYAYTPYNEDHQQQYFIHVGGKFNSWGALAHTPLTSSADRRESNTSRLKGFSSASGFGHATSLFSTNNNKSLMNAAANDEVVKESDHHHDVSAFLLRGHCFDLLQDGKIRLLVDGNENQDEDLSVHSLSSGSPQLLGGLFKAIAMCNHEAMHSRYSEYHAPSAAKAATATNNAANTPWGARSFRKSVSMRMMAGDNPEATNGGGSGALRRVNSQGSSAADGLPPSSLIRAQSMTKAAAAHRTASSVGRTASAASTGGGEAQRTFSTRTNQSTTSQQQPFSVSKEATSPFLLFPIPPRPIDPSDFSDCFDWGGGDGSTFSGRQGVKTLDELRLERYANIARSLLGLSTVLSATSMEYTMYTHVAMEPSVWELMRQPGMIKHILDGSLSRASVEHQLEEIATAVSFYRGPDAALAMRGKKTVGQEEHAISPSPLQLAGSSVLETAETAAMGQHVRAPTGIPPTEGTSNKPVRLPPSAISMSTKAVVRHFMPSGYYYSGCVEHCERKRRACVTNSWPATGSNQTSRPATGSPQLAAGRLGTSVAYLSPNNLNNLDAKGASASASVFSAENLQSASTPCSPSRGRNRSVSRASFASTAAPGASPTRSGLSRDGGADPFSNPATAAFLSSLLYDDAFPPSYFKDSERNSEMVSARGPTLPFAVHLQKAVLEGVNDANVARKDVLWRSGPMDYYLSLAEALYPPRQNDGKAAGRTSSTSSSRRVSSAFGGGGATVSSDAGLRGGLRSLAAVANARWAASVAKGKPASSPAKKK